MSFENVFTNEEIYAIGKHLVQHGEWRRHKSEYAMLAIRLPYGADLSSTGTRVDELNKIIKQRLEAGQHETIVNFPKPHTAEFLTYLLVNALRNLNEAQRHNLAISLAVRDPLFTIEEYEKQNEN